MRLCLPRERYDQCAPCEISKFVVQPLFALDTAPPPQPGQGGMSSFSLHGRMPDSACCSRIFKSAMRISKNPRRRTFLPRAASWTGGEGASNMGVKDSVLLCLAACFTISPATANAFSSRPDERYLCFQIRPQVYRFPNASPWRVGPGFIVPLGKRQHGFAGPCSTLVRILDI